MEEVKEVSADPKEDVEEPIEGEVEPEFVFGVTLIQLPDGQGLQIQPNEGPQFQRVPTINDLLCVAAQLDSHIRAINIAGKHMELSSRKGIIKPGGRIQ